MNEQFTVLRSDVLAPGGYIAFEIVSGQAVRIVDLEGQQVTDFMSFSQQEPSERLSMYTSRAANRSWKLTAGHTLYSTLAEEMWRIEVDTVGENYAGGGFCNPAINERRYGAGAAPTCLGNFKAALEPFNLGPADFDYETCFNVFMTVAYEPDGRWEILKPKSRAGDRIEFTAMMNQIVTISNCPQLHNACNAGRLKPVEVTILGKKGP